MRGQGISFHRPVNLGDLNLKLCLPYVDLCTDQSVCSQQNILTHTCVEQSDWSFYLTYIHECFKIRHLNSNAVLIFRDIHILTSTFAITAL